MGRERCPDARCRDHDGDAASHVRRPAASHRFAAGAAGQVTFWGFDGKRSRGAVVVSSAVASRAAAAFFALYEQRFRIRQMRPMDSGWGKNPKGPGANDYAAMEADNTSAFNCSGGTAYPDTYWLHRRGAAPGVFSTSDSGHVDQLTGRRGRRGCHADAGSP